MGNIIAFSSIHRPSGSGSMVLSIFVEGNLPPQMRARCKLEGQKKRILRGIMQGCSFSGTLLSLCIHHVLLLAERTIENHEFAPAQKTLPPCCTRLTINWL